MSSERSGRHERRVGGHADGAVGRALGFEQFAGVVGDFGDLERGMEAEVDHVEVGRRGKADLAVAVRWCVGGVQLGVDDVAGDVERRALRSARPRGARRLRRGPRRGGRERQRRVPGAGRANCKSFRFCSFVRSLCLPPFAGGLIRGGRCRLASWLAAGRFGSCRRRRRKRFDLLQYDCGYPFDGGSGGLVAWADWPDAHGAPPESLPAPFSWTPERGRRVAAG